MKDMQVIGTISWKPVNPCEGEWEADVVLLHKDGQFYTFRNGEHPVPRPDLTTMEQALALCNEKPEALECWQGDR